MSGAASRIIKYKIIIRYLESRLVLLFRSELPKPRSGGDE
jgi:hypothetical protein